jgi:hypothetical protein
MKLDHPTRVTIAVLLIVLSSLISTARLVKYKAGFSPEQIGRDPVSLYEKRFDEIKKDLPAFGTIGYITDKYYKNIGLDQKAATDYYLTRYALSPVLVTSSVTHPLVIGNFHDTSAGLKTATEAGIILIKDYGNGLMLFKGKTK